MNMNNLGNMSIHDGMNNMALPMRYTHTRQKMKSEIQTKQPVAFVPSVPKTRKVLPITQSMPIIFHVTDVKPVFSTRYFVKRPYATPRQIANARARKNILQQQNPFVVVVYDDDFAIKKEQNLKQLVAEYEHENPSRSYYEPNVSADIINTMQSITATKLYDAQMEQDYDNWECNRDMINMFRELSENQLHAWAAFVAPKTNAYCKALRVYGKTLGISEQKKPVTQEPQQPKSRTKNITPAQMRSAAKPDLYLTNHDLQMIVNVWNNQHRM